MLISLFCLIRGQPISNAFEIKIGKEKSVSALREEILKEKPNAFHGVDADELTLWKVDMEVKQDLDLVPDLPSTPSELAPAENIEEMFTDPETKSFIEPMSEHIHIIVDAPMPKNDTVREKELLAQIDLLRQHIRGENVRLPQIERKLQEPSATFELIVAPKTVTTVSWTVNLHTVTFDELKTKIWNKDDPTLLSFEFKRGGEIYIHETNEALRDFLRTSFVANEMRINVSVTTPSKVFSSYTLDEVWNLYGLREQYGSPIVMQPDIWHLPLLDCRRVPMSSNVDFDHLMFSLQRSLSISPLSNANEATKSSYVRYFLMAVISDFISDSGSVFFLSDQEDIRGRYGHGPVDFAIGTRMCKVVGVTEVKKEDFRKGVAQNAVQIESALPRRKRKADEMDEVEVADPRARCFGIVSDARTWRFLECTRDNDDNPIFRISTEFIVYYENEGRRREDVTRIVEIIKWLLTEVKNMMGGGQKTAPAPEQRKKNKQF